MFTKKCRHLKSEHIRNIFGKEIQRVHGMRSEWKCLSCGEVYLKVYPHNQYKRPKPNE